LIRIAGFSGKILFAVGKNYWLMSTRVPGYPVVNSVEQLKPGSIFPVCSVEGSSMPEVTFRFYEELNDFLPEWQRKQDFQSTFNGRESVKDKVEALGVPHTEVDLILVNGNSVDFGYILQDGDRISVYPVFETLEIQDVTRLRKVPLRQTRFVADWNLRNVVKTLRALGLDVVSLPSLTPRQIVEISKSEKRTILTGSRNLLKLKDVTHGIFLRPGTTIEQVRYVLDLLSLRDRIKPFSRCLLCNTALEEIPKERVSHRIPPKTRAVCDEYAYCRSCDKLFWKGNPLCTDQSHAGTDHQSVIKLVLMVS